MQLPLVSALIPVHNAAAYLSETLNSVLAQKPLVAECILIDDHSTDNSLAIVQDYVSRHPGTFRYAINDNKGACAARNKAFELSTGKYIQFLDADDLLSPDKIAFQLKLFERYGDDIIVSGQWDRFYNNPEEAVFPDRYLDRDWDNPVDWLVNSWEGKGMAQTAVWLTPRKLIEKAGPWNEDLKINQDGEFFCRALLAAKSIRFCPEAKVYYRSGMANSVSKQPGEEKAASLLLSYQLYQEHVMKKHDTPQVRHALLMNYSSVIYQFYHLYPHIAGEALRSIRNLGFRAPEFRDGRWFNLLAKAVGFRSAFRLRDWFKKRS